LVGFFAFGAFDAGLRCTGIARMLLRRPPHGPRTRPGYRHARRRALRDRGAATRTTRRAWSPDPCPRGVRAL